MHPRPRAARPTLPLCAPDLFTLSTPLVATLTAAAAGRPPSLAATVVAPQLCCVWPRCLRSAGLQRVEGQPWVPARRGWVPARSSANHGSPRINGLLVVPRGFYSELRVAALQRIFSDKQLQTCRPRSPARRTGWTGAGARRGHDAGSALLRNEAVHTVLTEPQGVSCSVSFAQKARG